jgi:hypothetical protein
VIAQDVERDGEKFPGRRIIEVSERRKVAAGDTPQQRLEMFRAGRHHRRVFPFTDDRGAYSDILQGNKRPQ